MLASELIVELAVRINLYGDIPVNARYNCDNYYISVVDVSTNFNDNKDTDCIEIIIGDWKMEKKLYYVWFKPYEWACILVEAHNKEEAYEEWWRANRKD